MKKKRDKGTILSLNYGSNNYFNEQFPELVAQYNFLMWLLKPVFITENILELSSNLQN